MLLLLVGAKGGVGTTAMALELARGAQGIGLDLADGQLAARLGRRTWALVGLAFSTPGRRRVSVEWIIQRRATLLWTPECGLAAGRAWGIVRAVADRALVVADGGIEPPQGASEIADAVLVVTAGEDSAVVRYHVERLERRFPAALVAPHTKEIVHSLTDQLHHNQKHRRQT
jgi:hypothetical protein